MQNETNTTDVINKLFRNRKCVRNPDIKAEKNEK